MNSYLDFFVCHLGGMSDGKVLAPLTVLATFFFTCRCKYAYFLFGALWVKRFFVLYPHKLQSFKSEQDKAGGRAFLKGCIMMRERASD
jgi:hypothetical protein